ncbi:MAG: hypothetical protein WAP37_04170 [Solirubrobacterales bacterium]
MSPDADRRRLYAGIGLIALFALAITVLPGGGEAVEVISAALQAAFLAAMAFAAWRLYRSRATWLSSLPDRHRGVLYAAIATAVWTVVAIGRFRELGGAWALPWIAVMAASGFAVFWVWRESRRYSF